MTPEERALLERTYKLAEENNEILRKIRRAGRWQIAFRVFYWAVIIFLTVGAYYLIQPYVDAVREVFDAPPSQDPTSSASTSPIKKLLGL